MLVQNTMVFGENSFSQPKSECKPKLFFFKKRGTVVSLAAKNSSKVFFGLVFVFSTDLSKCYFLVVNVITNVYFKKGTETKELDLALLGMAGCGLNWFSNTGNYHLAYFSYYYCFVLWSL